MRRVQAESVVVVVPAISVDDLVVRCVQECRRLNPDKEVVVVVDDDSGAHRLGGSAVVLVAEDRGIAAKRNQGVEATESRHVAFIDSDAYPAPGWLDNAVALLDSDPTLGAVGGPNVSPPQQTGWERAVGRSHRSPLVDGWWRFRKDPQAAPRDVSDLPSCNLVVRRQDYEALGGMNEDLFTAEDIDFCVRLTGVGRRIRFTPDVLVYHKDRGLGSFLIQRFTFGVAMVPLLQRGSRPRLAYTCVSVALGGFVTLLFLGPLGLRSRRLRRLWTLVAGVYGCVIAAEALRLAEHRDDLPRVAVALVIGNTAPGAGVVLRALRLSPELRGLYRNDR